MNSVEIELTLAMETSHALAATADDSCHEPLGFAKDFSGLHSMLTLDNMDHAKSNNITGCGKR